ncbi:MAG: hypothetical protein ACFFDJ_06695 [Candidatus Odinarchaeota archaeon]
MNLTARKKEEINTIIRFIIIALCGGVMITFGNFTILIALLDGLVFFLLMLAVGILIGLYSSDLHYAIIGGLASIFLGFFIFILAIMIPIIVFATWQLYEILVLFGILVIIRVIMLELIGIMLGTVIGRIIGPNWYVSRIAEHKLRIGIDEESASETE